MEARSESKSLSRKVLSLVSTSRNPFRKGVVSKLNDVTKKLEDMIKEKDVLGLKESVAPGRMPTTSLVEESEVYGRNQEKEQIIELLLSPETGSSKLGVIAIVGMGGLGKTTLAQLVYNDVRVKESFGFRSWISVSDVFDVVRVTKAILESITDQLCEMQDLERLQVKLREELKKKRSLIVLDDVWSESNDIWDLLKKPFNESVHGSKLLVTTRNEGVASVMGAIPIFRLKELSDEDGWSLFSQRAFENGNCCPDDSPLVAVGRKIVQKCKGLPLAIKTLAGLLRSKAEITQLEDILNSSIWGLSKERNDIVPALRLSYHYLPSQLKRCFAYCAIFPKDYQIKEENLVLLWMAEGFVAQPENDRRIEDVGDEYFQELVSRSFFHQVLNEDGCECYMMHDLIHDLAQFMAGDFCFRLEEEQQCKSFKRARHIAYSRGQNDGFHRFEVLSKHLSLRISRGGLAAPNLEELSIRECGNLKSLPLQMHKHLTSLKWLAITHCPGLEPIQERDPFPLGLNSLAIGNFERLTSRWTDSERKNFLQKFQFLEILHLKDCSSVECFPPEKGSLPMTLQRLGMWHFPNLKWLNGESFQSLNCLQVLVIDNCPKLQAFAEEGLPSSVSELWITGCSPVLKKRCQKGIGQDWPKISHIQVICIE
ncbi:hypothetical protein Ancab_019886 [Ancistrocladus abbreviatus]